MVKQRRRIYDPTWKGGHQGKAREVEVGTHALVREYPTIHIGRGECREFEHDLPGSTSGERSNECLEEYLYTI